MTTRPTPKLRTLAPTLVGTAVALMLGSGMVALVTDTVTSTGNRLRAPALANPVDLRVGHTSGVSTTSGCVDLSDTTTTPMRFGGPPTWTPDGVLPESGTLGQGDNFCLVNAGEEPVTVSADFVNVVAFDGGCGPREVDVDADCTAPLGSGELDDPLGSQFADAGVVTVTFLNAPEGPKAHAFHCWMAASACNVREPVDRTITTLDPGEQTVVFLRFAWTTDQARRQASQTDQVQWDLAFTAVEVS